MKKQLALIMLVFCSMNTLAKTDVPSFIDSKSIENAKFICRNAPQNYSDEEKILVDKLWDETIIYLGTLAEALSTSQSPDCTNSDTAIRQTGSSISPNKPIRQCIMDNRDVQVLVKHLYTIVHNKEKAFQCFSPQKRIDGLYSPNDTLERQSDVAMWLKRPSLHKYYQNSDKVQIQTAGTKFSEQFYSVTTDDSIKMPLNFVNDISARALPTLWASVGWVPMYSTNTERNQHTGDENFRAGYAYAEIMGHWGLLQIDSINGEAVGAEIGMTVQSGNTFYPYHHHDTNEIYYTIREPSCNDGIKQFVVSPEENIFTLLSSLPNQLVIQLEGSKIVDLDSYWAPTTPSKDALLYIPRNSIHAFNLTEKKCDNQDYAHVTVWARTNAHEKNEDYGTTNICRLKDTTLPKDTINKINPDIICYINRTSK